VPDATDNNLPKDVPALQAEVMRLRETLRSTLLEKDRVLRLLRNTNTDLHSRVQGQTRQLTALNQLITTLNASLDLREVAASALSGLHQLLSVEAAALALKDNQAWIRYFQIYPATLLPAVAPLRLRPGEGLLGRVIESGQAFFANELGPASLTPHDRVPGLSLRSVVCQPLIARERVIGAVQLINKWSGPFTDGDRAFVETVAGSLAVAVENARLYQEAQTQLATLEQAHAQLVGRQAEPGPPTAELAARLAHDLGGPLDKLLGLAQRLGQAADDPPLKAQAAAIELEARHLQRLINDLLPPA
jgi:GAF domain-containing protein